MRLSRPQLKTLLESLILKEGQVEDLLAANPQLQLAINLGIRNPNHLKWLLLMEKFEPIADTVGLIPAFEQNKQRLTVKDLDSYKNPNDLRAALEALGESKGEQRRQLKKSETDIIYDDEQWIVVMPHTMESSIQWGKGTTWCTAATKTANLFYNYTGNKYQDIILFYIIRKDADSKIDPNAKLSVGFIEGQPILDGQDGGLTVNALNKGMTQESVKKILGSNFDLIMKSMESHAKKIDGKHPAKVAMQKIRQSKNVSVLDSYTKGMNEEQKDDFINILLEYDDVSVELLSHLANNKYVNVNVVTHPNTPLEILTRLASHDDSAIRQGVAYNHNTTATILALLAKDESVDVRREVAQNTNTSAETLTLLTRDVDNQIRATVAYNPNTTPTILTLLSSDKDEWTRRGVAQNPNTPIKILSLLARDKDKEVRVNTLQNPTYQKYLESQNQLNERWLRLAGLLN